MRIEIYIYRYIEYCDGIYTQYTSILKIQIIILQSFDLYQKTVTSPTMTLKHLAPELYKFFLSLHQSGKAERDIVSRLYQWFNSFFLELAKSENLQFTTHFARIAYVCHKHKINSDTQWRLHHYRRLSQQIFYYEKDFTADEYRACFQIVAECVAAFSEAPIPDTLKAIFPEQEVFVRTPMDIVEHKDKVRVFILENDKEQSCFLARIDDINEPATIRIKYNQPGINEAFEETIFRIDRIWQNRVTVNLVDVMIQDDGVYLPRIFIIEPDFLLDVTAVSNCFQSFGTEPLMNLIQKFLPFQSSLPILLGNVVNYFLDELMTNPEADFLTTFRQAFRLSPLGFSMFDDKEIRQMVPQAQRHFSNLYKVVKEQLPAQNIQAKNCFLEPGFYSEKYGLQGRLDIWHSNPELEQYDIVELKSGKPFMPNKHGVSSSHYIQTLLYDLLIRSVYGEDKKTIPYILYSKLSIDGLKFAPPVALMQHEALNTRNQLLSFEEQLIQLDKRDYGEAGVLDLIKPEKLPKATGFTRKNVQYFSEIMRKMTDLERRYVLSFSSFIAREHRYAKTGIEGREQANGLASLWRSPFRAKQENFDIINHLKIVENLSQEDPPTLIFEKTERSTPLANFREGDIAVLYPTQTNDCTVLTNQIFKCNIIKMEHDRITIRLRSKQFNDTLFREELHWNLEHDLMDSGFNTLYRNLFSFVQFPAERKNLLLGLQAPRQAELKELPFNEKLSEEQGRILEKAISAQDYFLLIGPPGTGKTKFMLREMVYHLLKNTKENLLLLAYTNRAVDEICEAIDDFASEDYMRIGSSHATAAAYRPRLFSEKIAKIETRAALKAVIEKHRIIVSTVTSMGNRPQLFKLKQFDRMIIDEASQILEPMLVGLLPRVPRFVLIGDHKQLPAVVVQNKEESAIEDEKLLEVGLYNRRNSLFERLFKLCQKNNWHWAYDMLTHQGRMHQDISEFPNRFFYNNNLKLLPEDCSAGAWQNQPLVYKKQPDSPTPLELTLAQHRIVFIPTPEDDTLDAHKINRHESRRVTEVIQAFSKLYQLNQLEFTLETLGVITPYRAQIAEIRSVLDSFYKEESQLFSVDTVERYQGGARDIIVISLCLNAPFQMASLVSMSDDGLVDRKLNVALTRARKHLVILGNELLMRLNPVYDKLVDFVKEHGGVVEL